MTITYETEAPPVPPARKTPLTSVNVAVATRDALNRTALEMSVKVGRRISISALAVGLVALAERHAAELEELLRPAPAEESS